MLHISETIQQQILSNALSTFPNECCGFLLGKEDGEERTVKKILTVNNAKEGDKRRRFVITAQDYTRAEQYADEHNFTLLGVYHSHPNHPSVASEHDRVSAQPYFSYVIIAIRENEFVSIQSWRLNDEFQFEEEQINKAENISNIKF